MVTQERLEQHLNGMSWDKLCELGHGTWRLKASLIERKLRGEVPADRLAGHEQAIIRITNLRESLRRPIHERTAEMLGGPNEQR